MSGGNSELYRFGSYQLDVRRRVFMHDERMVPLAPKTFDLLLLLLRNPGRAFSKQELMTALWPDTFVEEANLSFQISTLRKALGDEGVRWIETVPKHGYRFASDVRSSALADIASSEPSVTTIPSPLPAPPTLSRRTRWLAVIAVAALLALTSYLLLVLKRAPAARAHTPAAVPLTAYQGFENSPSLSPDGSQVAFSWNGADQDNFDIYVKLVGPGEPVHLTNDPARDDNPAWSPDGRLIAFLRFRSYISADLFVTPALGGAERKLASISLRRRAIGSASRVTTGSIGNLLTWTPDGKWIAFGGGPSEDEPRGIWLIRPDGSGMHRLTEITDHDVGDWGPAFSSDGRFLAFMRERTVGGSAIYVLPLTAGVMPAGDSIPVTHDSTAKRGLAWTPDGRELLFSRSGHLGLSRLYTISATPTTAASEADPELLPFGEQATSLSISRTGRLVYSAQFRDAAIWKVVVNADGTLSTATPIAPSTFDEQTPAYSPDGKRLAFASTRSGVEEIWLSNVDGTNPIQVTSTGGPMCANPQWSPNGKILFNSRREGSSHLYLLSPDSGEVSRITNDPAEDVEPRWSRDGRTIYFGSNRTGRQEVWKMPAEGGRPERITKHGGLTATESRDGFLYYAKDDRSPTAIWRVPVGGGEEQPVVEGLSYSLNFVVADRGIYFLALGDAPPKTSIDFFEFATGRRTTLLTLGKEWWFGMALSTDQKSLLYSVIDNAGSNLMLVDKVR
jgi:Tol biopolymer transport system component/DNA-binding winged helix-turn-helix (wHTH) protein